MEVNDNSWKYWRDKWQEAQKELTVLRSLVQNQIRGKEKKIKKKAKKP